MKSKLLASRLAIQSESDSRDSLRSDNWVGSNVEGAPAPRSIITPGPQNLPPTAGGIAFTGFNADGTDDIAFVAIQALDAGTVIYFTDNEWNGAAFTDAAEGLLSLTLTSAVAAGTIVTLSSMSAVTRSSSTGTLTSLAGALNLNAGDEVLYAYLANSGTPTAPTTFLAAIANGGFSAANGVLTGTGLTDGTNAVNLSPLDDDLDIAAYTGARSGQVSFSAYLPIVNNSANWIAQDGAGNQDQDTTAPDIPFSPTGFTLSAGLPVLSVDDVTMAEGDSGTVTFFFTVSLSAPAGPGGVTFDIATADGTAQDDNPGAEDNDYVPVSLTGQTIPAGSSTYSFQVTVNGDNAPEVNETFFVNVTNVTGATVGDGQGQGTITNDDTPGSLAIGDVTLAEGNSGTTSFSFTVTRSGGSEGIVGATWTLNLPGGANADAGDLDAGQLLDGSVTFADGDTSETITVLVKGDAVVEPDEGFTITLSAPTGGATITDDTGAGTITNDDSPPVASIADTSLVEGDDGVTYLVFTVTLDHPSNDPVTYDYATANGTAAAGSDYVALTGQVAFAAGETTQTISVPLIGDVAPENNETLTVTLSNPAGGTIGDGVATGTITNDDGAQYYSLAGGSFTQNWTNTGQITANDSWSGVPYIIGYLGDIDAGSTTNVDARTLTGANLGAIDVIANLANTTSNSGGVGEFHIADPVVGLQGSGTADAPSLVLYMDATGRSSVRLQANLRDIDNSAPGGIEDNSAQQINVQYRTSPGGTWTNVPGAYFADATALGASQVTALDVTLPAGADNAGTLEIRIMTTNAAGNDEWVGIDDIIVSSQVSAPSLSIANAAVIEGDSGPTIITFTVTRAGDSAGAVTADWTAVFGGGPYDAEVDDFTVATPLSGQVAFADGQTSATFTLSVDGDVGPEVDENFTIQLSNPSGATIADGTATGTIVNDDGAPPLVTINDVTVTEGDSGTVLMTFTVTRTGGTGAFDVDWQTADGTATAPGDYAANSGTINFAAGQMSDTVTVAVTVNGDTDSELSETLQVTLSNATNFAVITDAVGIGTIASDDPIYIHDIQGTAYFSPILAAEGIGGFNSATVGTVIVRAVVTAVDNDGTRQGFYLQEEVTDWDGNSFTSEGIFVMTRNDAGVGSVVSGVSVGDLVTVTAHVMEYQGFSSNMPITALTSPTSIVVVSSGNVLPTFTLGAMPTAIMTSVQPDYADSADGVGDSFDASLYALSYWETVEGMLVTVPDMVVADGFVTTSGGQPIFQAYSQSLTDADQINGRGGLTIAGDPPIGPPDTAETVDDTTNGGRALTDGDINPDIIEVDFTGFAIDAPAGLANSASMGDYLGDVTGIIDFDFTDRKLFVTDWNTGQYIDNTTTQDTTGLGNDSRALTVATFNVENLDPGDGAARFTAIANVIATNLNAPDIVCIEEMQDNNGATASGGADASTTWQMLVNALNLATGSNYQWVDQEPNGSEGGEPGGNIRVGFLYNTDRVQLGDLDAGASLADRRMYTDRIGDGVRDAGDLIAFDDSMLGAEIQTGDWSGTRRSLLGEFTFNGNVVYVTANHWPAKGGSDDFWEFNQNPAIGEPTNSGWTQRNNNAQDVYAMLDLIETNAPGSGIVSGGDYNDFYFYRPLTTVTGYTLADGTARVGGARFDNLTLTLPEAERYTYNFDGRSQAIDHIVVNSMLSAVATYDVVHLNTGFNAGDPTPLSDHDPGLSSFDFRSLSENLRGTSGADIIEGEGGDDTIRGFDGNDALDGGDGEDIVVGGEGDDIVVGGADHDVLVGQDGDDFLGGGSGAGNEMIGGEGDDTYYVTSTGDTLVEGSGGGTDRVLTLLASFSLEGLPEIENLAGLSGTGQTLTGNDSNNIVIGQAGDDILSGGLGRDVLIADGGNDLLIGGDGLANELIGGAGDDTYIVTASGDTVVEQPGGGTDTVRTSLQYYVLQDNVENLVFIGSGDFTGIGNGAANVIVGGAGNDRLSDGGGAADTLIGGGGNDTYVVTAAGTTIVEHPFAGTDTVETDLASYAISLAAIENLTGTLATGQSLTGNVVANVITGANGADVLSGGLGADTLTGNGGADFYLFDSALGGGNIDTIMGFVSGSDHVLLDNGVFTALGEGSLNPNAFVLGTAAQDADDRIVYDSTTGALYYDADGSGAGAAVQFATLGGNPIVTASDFIVI